MMSAGRGRRQRERSSAPSASGRHRRLIPARWHLRALRRGHGGARPGRCVAGTAALALGAASRARQRSPWALRRGGTARSGALRPLRGSHARSSRGVPPLLAPGGRLVRQPNQGGPADPASDGRRLRASRWRSPSPARAVPRRCASWPSSPNRRSSAASLCTGPGASNAPANPGARPRAGAAPPPSPRPGRLGSPFAFRPAPAS